MPVRWLSAAHVRGLLASPTGNVPLYRDLADRIRMLVVDGRLAHGVRMPSERELAVALGVSRSTVAAGYAELRSVGLLQARPGSGNFVTAPAGRPDASSPWSTATEDGVIGLTYASTSAPEGLASYYASAALRLPELMAGTGYFPDGLLALRLVLADWFTGRGLPTDPDQLVVTTGALSALNIVARTVLAPGDRVLMESPTYPNAIEAVRRCGGRPVPYPLPPGGWQADDLELTLRQTAPAMAYLIPDHQNPTGAWMSEQVRPAVAAALQRTRTVAVVDETLVEVTLDGDPPRKPLGAYLPGAVTIGSASKAFWGGLRIGWIRAPKDLVRPLIETRAATDLGAAPFEQLVLADLLADPAAVLTSQRLRLRRQRDHLRSQLEVALPDWATSQPPGGLALWATLPDELSSRFAGRADRHGLLVTAGPRFFVGGGGERHLRLPYTADTEVLSEAVRRLAAVWAEVGQSPVPRRVSESIRLTA